MKIELFLDLPYHLFFSNYVCEKYKIPALCLEWRENLHGRGRDKNDMSKYVEFF